MPETITLEGYPLVFSTNFRGLASEFNSEGARNFNILIENLDEAEQMLADGWHLRPLTDDDSGDVTAYSFKVNVKYRNRKGEPIRYPPRVYQVRPGNLLELDEDTIDLLDLVRITAVDVTVNPYEYTMSGGGISAYCRELYAHVELSTLESKYADWDEEPEFEYDE